MSLTTEIPVIVGGKLQRTRIERPSATRIIVMAAAAIADGFGLDGTGPIKRVTGSTITIVVGPTGCTCANWRNGIFCHHAALSIVETGAVQLPPMTTGPACRAPSRCRFPRTRRTRRIVEQIIRNRDETHRRWPVRVNVEDVRRDDVAA